MREVLQRRIGRLPATAQTMLGQAAVLGTETDVDVLGDVAGAGEDGCWTRSRPGCSADC